MRILVSFIIFVSLGVASAQDECRFAPKYNQSDLITSEDVREEFLLRVVRQESKFMKEIGYNNRTGLTYDGQQLDVATGLPYKGPHLFTASSKESIHVAALAQALTNNKYASEMYTKDEALDVIKKKIDSYEQFNKDYPGYGGFLPWIQINDQNVTPTWDWTEGVPSLDNGQLFWAAYGLVSVLEDWYPHEVQLINRWTNFYQTMAKNSIKIFYQGEGKIRTVTKIKDIKLPVEQNEYTNKLDGCDVDFDVVCWLDDPYEGELFAFMMYFFAPWENQTEAEKMWDVKRGKLQAVNYFVPELNTNITVQKGWWFSAHETWKYLFLPYQYDKVNQQIFLNCEKVRTWDARINGRPGMFASVNGNITQNGQDGGYFSACGVQEVAYENVTNHYLITPYSTMGAFLANKTVATAWFHNMISGPAGQNKWGSTEGSSIYGDSVAPMTTWDAKITTTLAIMGGLADYTAKKLSWDNKLSTFLQVVRREWGAVFTDIQGIDAPYALPNVTIPHGKGREDFISCQVNDFGSDFAWGVATAAYQVEGAADEDGRGRSIWDDFCDIPGRVANNENGKVADDFYHKYKEDIQMMKSLNIKHFRMSISWSRILPNGTSTQPNPLGVQFYNDLFDELLNNGITPWVTLYHWDLPSAYFNKTAQGGWLGRDIIDKFVDYADFCFKTFGGKVKHWITFNEPQSFAWLGYGLGIHAPGRCSFDWNKDKCVVSGGGGDSSTEPYIVSHNVILAHGYTVKKYREVYQQEQGGEIGMDVATYAYEPWDPNSQWDVDACDTKLVFEYAYYYDPLVFGDYPEKMKNLITGNRLPTFTDEEKAMLKGSYDYLGFNYYAGKYARLTNQIGSDYGSDPRIEVNDRDKYGNLIGPYADSSWLTVYSPGLRNNLKWMHERYNAPKIYVFENGASAPGEQQKSIDDAVHDGFRQWYYTEHVNSMKTAITEDGVNVKGWFGWSLMDNFEWTDGYSVRFGMVYIDYPNNQTRHIKDSAQWYSQWIQNHTLTTTTSSLEAHGSTKQQKQVFV